MTSRLVVTGVDGFVGRHLARAATDAGLEVFGISRSTTVDAALRDSLVGYASADLRASWPASAPVDVPIVHLAGLAAVGPSYDRPQEYIDGNSAMVTNLCEALLRAGTSPRIVVVSTGAVYARMTDESPQAETDPIAFTSPYVVSKVVTENQIAYYRLRGLDAVVARPFNHLGPGQAPGFLVPDLVSRLLTLGPDEALTVGNLDSRRDYTDVRDVVDAYLRLATAPALAHDLYNVASGTTRSGSEILSMICRTLGVGVPRVTVNPAWVRANDPAIIVGDAGRLTRDVGWRPSIPLSQTIADVVSAVAGSEAPGGRAG